jgi:hypothetical protein
MPVTTRLMTFNRSYENDIKKFADSHADNLASAVEHGVNKSHNSYKIPELCFIPIPINKIKMNVLYDMYMKYFNQYNTTNAYIDNFYAMPTWSAGVNGITLVAVARWPRA